jgi:ArsR family transcriptional regulator, arsenate/arsenite/antimonite-responsive transcriptional repressor
LSILTFIDILPDVTRSDDPDVRLLAAAADPTRLAILRQLSVEGAVCACDFAACCDVAQPTVSHHLKVLREAGWVTGERRGTWIWYSIRPEAVARFRVLAAEVSPAGPQPAGSLGRTDTGPRPLPVLAPRG